MNKKIISVAPNNNIRESINKMKKFGISQMPVLDDHNVIGLVSESTLLDALMSKKSKNVDDIMEESPPTVSKKASIQIISNLLRHYPMVLVSDSGKLIGLISSPAQKIASVLQEPGAQLARLMTSRSEELGKSN